MDVAATYANEAFFRDHHHLMAPLLYTEQECKVADRRLLVLNWQLGNDRLQLKPREVSPG